MAKFKRVKSTIPSRTWSGRKVQVSSHAIYLKLSFLAQERRRRQIELENLKARIDLLCKRIASVDVEMEKLSASLPAASNTAAFIADADPVSLPPGLLIRY